ncbi:MAG: hypothetical protein Q9220_002458 [cf. Caloplaca sp. 1 TL-2023]
MSLVSGPGRAQALGSSLPNEIQLVAEKHVKYIQELDKRKDELEYWLTEHLRLNGVYWGLTALHLLHRPDALPRDAMVDFVLSCQQSNGGFGAAPGHDAHMLYTVSAVQILVTLDALQELDERGKTGCSGVGNYISKLQNPDNGSFAGDEWGETDTRFLYGALNALSLLGLLHTIDTTKAVSYVQACANVDGGYGVSPGAESHAGQIFVCVGSLAIAGKLHLVDKERLGAWLSERQLDNGGLNGRPEKLEDVCYSWWVLSSLALIEKLHWIDKEKLSNFILLCQDLDLGGIADRPGDVVDVFHTVFGLAGLSLLGYPGLVPVDPAYCMPIEVVNRALGSREDPAIRQELDAYERWYARYDIEKLLSQRMVLKDSKRPNGTVRAANRTRAASDKPAKIPKPRKKRTAAVANEQPRADAAPKDVIDPRLSQPVSNPTPSLSFQQLSPSTSSPGLDLTSIRQAPVPRMRTFHMSAPPLASHINQRFYQSLLSPSLAPASGPTEDDTENDYEQLRQPSIRSIYPDPPSTETFPTSSKPRDTGSPPFQSARGRMRQKHLHDEPADIEQSIVPQTPELKGVYYPGMSIFDSASPEAQRKRNQRKNGSMIAQIEQESLEVECNEYIYWPDGDLKMCRFITGDVQSSPFKEDTPPPPPPKRRRGRKPKTMTGDAVQQVVADSSQASASQAQLLKNESSIHERVHMSPMSPSMVETWSPVFNLGLPPSHTREDETDWLLNMSEPVLRPHRRIPIYVDHDANDFSPPGGLTRTYPNPLRPSPRQHSHHPTSRRHAVTSTTGNNTLSKPSQGRASSDHLHSRFVDHRASMEGEDARSAPTKTIPITSQDKENMPPPSELPRQERELKPYDIHPSFSHRYFLTRDGQKPEFSNVLPPEMAFAGMPIPPVYRTSLNPLNPNAHLRPALPYASEYAHYHPPRDRRQLELEAFTESIAQARNSVQDGNSECNHGAFML